METKFYMQMQCNSVRCQEFATIKKDYTSKKIIFHKKLLFWSLESTAYNCQTKKNFPH